MFPIRRNFLHYFCLNYFCCIISKYFFKLLSRGFLAAGNILSLPKTEIKSNISVNTCSNEFYLSHLCTYWKKASEHRPRFEAIAKTMREEILPNSGDYFVFSQKRLKARGRHPSSGTGLDRQISNITDGYAQRPSLEAEF